MKKIVFALVAILVACVASAEISVNFNTSTVIKDHNAGNLAIGSVFLVYWTGDASLTGFNSADPMSPMGGDVLLTPSGFDMSAGADIAGRITGHTADAFGVGSSLYSPGYLYIAVFELSYGSFAGSVPAGTYYGLGPISGALTQQYPSPSTVDQYGSTITTLTTSLQTVPEPSTLALLGMGIGLVAWRRFRK